MQCSRILCTKKQCSALGSVVKQCSAGGLVGAAGTSAWVYLMDHTKLINFLILTRSSYDCTVFTLWNWVCSPWLLIYHLKALLKQDCLWKSSSIPKAVRYRQFGRSQSLVLSLRISSNWIITQNNALKFQCTPSKQNPGFSPYDTVSGWV